MGFYTSELIVTGTTAYVDSDGPTYQYGYTGWGYTPKVLRDILVWNTTSDSAIQNVHLKTSWKVNEHYSMYRFIVQGYNYHAGLVINSEVVGYLYPPDNAIYNGGTKNYAAGVTISQYKSSDGYLTIKLASPAYWYYCGFSVSLHQYNPNVSVTFPTFTVYHQTANV